MIPREGMRLEEGEGKTRELLMSAVMLAPTSIAAPSDLMFPYVHFNA